MKELEKLFITKLESILELPCPAHVPRTGEEAKDIDCYCVYVSDEYGTYLASKVEENELAAYLWNEDQQKYTIPKTLSLDNLNTLNFEITHYKGLKTDTYTSWKEFAIDEASFIRKLLSKAVFACSKVKLFFTFHLPRIIISRKDFGEPNREQVLTEVVDLNKRNKNQVFEASKLLQNRYRNVTLHPDYPTLMNGH